MTDTAQDRRPIVLLDLDNTILDFNTAERHALGRAFAALGLPCDEEIRVLYHEINIRHWELLEDGLLTRDQVLVRRFEALFQKLGLTADADRAQALYEELLSEGHWFMPGALSMLEALSGPYRLFVCSNGTQKVQDSRIESAGIAKYFEDIFISERVGGNKPEALFFERCFDAIPDFQRDRCVILGDSLSSDIRGGLGAGILSCWYNPEGKANPGPLRPDYEIRRLDEFEGLLQKLFR